MAITISPRKVDTDDSGDNVSGTIHDNAWLQDLQDRIDGALAHCATGDGTGHVPDSALSSNVALKNIDNGFVAQTLAPGSLVSGSNGLFALRDTSGPVDAKYWRLLQYSDGILRVEALNDALTTAQGTGIMLWRTSGAAVNFLQIGLGGPSASLPALRNNGAQMECVTGNQGNWALFRAGTFVSTQGGNNLADLTCGATNFTNGVNGSGNVVMSGYIETGGVVFPGRVDITAPAPQLSWYLGSHPSYGLYSNTGLYLATGNLTVAGGAISCANGAAITGTLTVNTVTINVGALTLTGANGSITSYQGFFPGRVDVAGTQASWYLASHGSYGLYSNTGFYMAGYTWSAGYVTNSDARLKTDRGVATDLTALRRVVVHDFTWHADMTGVPDRGVFAQEVQAHFPRAVVAGADARTADGDLVKPWGADYSKFVADLIVGWQQHEAKIHELEQRLERMA